MTWVKVTDVFDQNPKVQRAGQAAAWLYFGPPDSGRPLAAIRSRAWVEWRRTYKRKRKQVKRQKVIERDGMVCQLCGNEIDNMEDLHIDHIVPLSRGGTSEIENLQPTHGRCNIRKGVGA